MSPYRTPWVRPDLEEAPAPASTLAAMVFGCVLGTIACLFVGCAANGGLTPDEAKTVDDYTAEQLFCVQKSNTLAESRACRCEVKAKYGYPCQEGGR